MTIDSAKGQRTLNLWLNGLTAGDQNRATFGGYWTETGAADFECQMPVVDGYGNAAVAWGQLELTFDWRFNTNRFGDGVISTCSIRIPFR